MKQIYLLSAMLSVTMAFAQPCPTFSTAISGTACSTTISIVNPVSTMTPPSTCSYTFLAPSFSGVVTPSTVLGLNTSTVATIAGTWSVLVRDNSNFCTTTQTVQVINGNPYFTASATAPTSSVNCNGSATINPQGNTNYTISATSGTVSGNFINGICVGPATVCLTNTITGCQQCNTYTVTLTTGISERNADGQIIIFPNPASGQVLVKGQLGSGILTVFNAEGRLVLQSELQSGEAEIKGLNPGIYFVEMKTDQFTARKKLLVLQN